MVAAIVREWHADLGWGVLDSPETPGGCWAHFSVIGTPLLVGPVGAAGVPVAPPIGGVWGGVNLGVVVWRLG